MYGLDKRSTLSMYVRILYPMTIKDDPYHVSVMKGKRLWAATGALGVKLPL